MSYNSDCIIRECRGKIKEQAAEVARLKGIAKALAKAGDPKPWLVDEWKKAKKALEAGR